MGVRRMFGIDLYSQDGKVLPSTITELEGDPLYKWFRSMSDAATVPIRILCVQIDSAGPVNTLEGFEVPLPENVIEHAIWKPEVYLNLTKNPAGGAVGLRDDPVRFILQTPIDGDPFCSLAMSRHGHTIKGIYIFTHDDFNPEVLNGGETSRSAWRSSGLQIVSLAEIFLRAHSVMISQYLANLIARVGGVERTLAESASTPFNFDNLSRTLHNCHADLMGLERRSRFEETVMNAIEAIASASTHGKLPWTSLDPQKTAVASRRFDFESLPRRIENCRATMSGLLQRRNEQLTLQLAQESHRIAEATLQDSKSMKTIAILTMVVLPGTAVASLFSMNMFDWSATEGSQIASKWLWIYFVVSIPLTGMILIAWWIWTRRKGSSTTLLAEGITFRTETTFQDDAGSMKDFSYTKSTEVPTHMDSNETT